MSKHQFIGCDQPYKSSFVEFLLSRKWHWFITIPIGTCSSEEHVIEQLRTIEAMFCGKYLVNRYHALPDDQRFVMVVAFEGTVDAGNRHAHVLAYIPLPMKKAKSHSMMCCLFPFEFRFLWNKLDPLVTANSWGPDQYDVVHPLNDLHIVPANAARVVYTAKDVRHNEVAWSRFEFVTPPKFKTFDNENLRQRRSLNHIRRSSLQIA